MFPFAAAVSLLPVLAGLRLWDRIPETVYSGIVSVTGQADSMPRPGLVFGLPCLLTVLTIICHIQLWFHQRAGNLPPGFVCVFGRWGMPAFSVLVITTFIRLGAGIPVSVPYLVLCGLGLLLLLAGSRILSGETEAVPLTEEKSQACTYCPYRAVCGYDRRSGGFRIRKNGKKDAGEVWLRIRESAPEQEQVNEGGSHAELD